MSTILLFSLAYEGGAKRTLWRTLLGMMKERDPAPPLKFSQLVPDRLI